MNVELSSSSGARSFPVILEACATGAWSLEPGASPTGTFRTKAEPPVKQNRPGKWIVYLPVQAVALCRPSRRSASWDHA